MSVIDQTADESLYDLYRLGRTLVLLEEEIEHHEGINESLVDPQDVKKALAYLVCSLRISPRELVTYTTLASLIRLHRPPVSAVEEQVALHGLHALLPEEES